MRSAFARRVSSCGILVAALPLSAICRTQQQVIPVWPGAAPGSEPWTQKEETTTIGLKACPDTARSNLRRCCSLARVTSLVDS
jgi:hypothetical protein